MRDERRPVWDWDRLDQVEFDRAVELLLYLKFSPTGRVMPVDGRGGDRGIDVFQVDADGRRTIYQLKCFPGGFSGKHKGRRDQILESLERARRHELDEWVLVWPSKPTPQDYTFVKDLRVANEGLTINMMHGTGLDALLVEFPDVINVMRRSDAVLELLTQLREESAALTGGLVDVRKRLRGFVDVIDGTDPDWSLDVATQGKAIFTTLRPKHPQAADVSPITFGFTAHLGHSHEQLRVAIRNTMGFGLPGDVTFPADTVKEFYIDGPPLVQQSPTDGVQITLSQPVNVGFAGCDVQLVLSHADGNQVGSYRGQVAHAGEGALGNGLELVFHNALTVTFMIPRERSGTCTMNVAYDPDGAGSNPILASRATQLVLDFQVATQMNVAVGGVDVFQASATDAFRAPDSKAWLEQLRDLHDLAEDLTIIGQHASADLFIPSKLTVNDRIWLRCMRRMLDGEVVMAPGAFSFDLNLTNPDDRGAAHLLKEDAGQLVVSQEPWTPTVAGFTVHLPNTRFWHPYAGLVDRRAAAKLLSEGKDAPATLKPLDGTTFRMFMPSLLKNPQEVAPVPWGLPGIAEKIPDNHSGASQVAANDLT